MTPEHLIWNCWKILLIYIFFLLCVQLTSILCLVFMIEIAIDDSRTCIHSLFSIASLYFIETFLIFWMSLIWNEEPIVIEVSFVKVCDNCAGSGSESDYCIKSYTGSERRDIVAVIPRATVILFLTFVEFCCHYCRYHFDLFSLLSKKSSIYLQNRINCGSFYFLIPF